MVKQVQTPQTGQQRTRQGAAPGQVAPNRARDGERDEIYGVVSVIYHALQGAETYQKYIDDARNAGDDELQQFFDTCRAEELERAKRAKSILLERLEEAADLEDEGDGMDEDDEDDDVEFEKDDED